MSQSWVYFILLNSCNCFNCCFWPCNEYFMWLTHLAVLFYKSALLSGFMGFDAVETEWTCFGLWNLCGLKGFIVLCYVQEQQSINCNPNHSYLVIKKPVMCVLLLFIIAMTAVNQHFYLIFSFVSTLMSWNGYSGKTKNKTLFELCSLVLLLS